MSGSGISYYQGHDSLKDITREQIQKYSKCASEAVEIGATRGSEIDGLLVLQVANKGVPGHDVFHALKESDEGFLVFW